MNNYTGNFAAQWSTQNQFWAWVDNNGNIIASDNVSGTRQVGVSIERYKQMESIANEATNKAEDYHKRLVEAGLIVVPPTQEEQIAMLTAQVAKLTQIIEGQASIKQDADNTKVTEIQKNEGTKDGHSGDGESIASQRQSVVGQNRTGTANSVTTPAIQNGARTVNAAIRKI